MDQEYENMGEKNHTSNFSFNNGNDSINKLRPAQILQQSLDHT